MTAREFAALREVYEIANGVKKPEDWQTQKAKAKHALILHNVRDEQRKLHQVPRGA